MLIEELHLSECILKEHFGCAVEAVGRLLMLRGDLSITNIIEELPAHSFPAVRNALLTLIQHNIVIPNMSVEQGGGGPQSVWYSIDKFEVLERMRYACYMQYVEKLKGRAAKLLMCEVMKYGRTTAPFAIQATLNDAYNRVEEESLNEEDRVLTEGTLRKAFIQLLASNILSTCKPPVAHSTVYDSPRHTFQSSHKMSGKRQHGGADVGGISKKGKTKASPADKIEIRNIVRYNCEEEEASNQLPKELLHMLADSTMEDSKQGGVTKPFRDKNNAVHEQKLEDILDQFIADKTLFRVNSEFMTFQLCKKLAENFMVARMGNNGVVRMTIRVLLSNVNRSRRELNRHHSFEDVKSNYLLFEDIFTAIKKNANSEGEQLPSKAILLRLLEAFVRHPDQMVVLARNDGVMRYAIDWQRFRSLLQRRVIFDAVRASCGENAARIWSLITSEAASVGDNNKDSKFWDDQTIADSVLLPPHVARETIYRLADSGMARLHESDTIYKANAAATNKHSLLVSCNIEQCKQKLLQNTQKMLLNLFERKMEERRRALKIVYSLREMSEEDQQHLTEREAGEDVLEMHIIKLDEPLMILRDL